MPMCMHAFSIISLSMIWHVKKVFADEKVSIPAPPLKKYVRGEAGKW